MSDLLKNLESAIELGNKSYCFISTSTLLQCQNEIVNLQADNAGLQADRIFDASKIKRLTVDNQRLKSVMIKEAAYIVRARFNIERRMSESQLERLQEAFVDCALRLKDATKPSPSIATNTEGQDDLPIDDN